MPRRVRGLGRKLPFRGQAKPENPEEDALEVNHLPEPGKSL